MENFMQPESAAEVDDMREEYDFSNSIPAPYAAIAGAGHIVRDGLDVSAGECGRASPDTPPFAKYAKDGPPEL